MNLLFLGPPGAGKGTIASMVAKRMGIPHISTGDLFREAIKNLTNTGKRVKEIVDKGLLVPDELTVQLVRERLMQRDVQSGFILDGFPRTVPQAEALEEISDVHCVINFVIDDEVIIERLSGRRVCKNCGKTYNTVHLPPKIEDKCDVCGGQLYIRDDDKEDAVRTRLSVYTKQTEPLIHYYEDKGKVKRIDATMPPDNVYTEIIKKIS